MNYLAVPLLLLTACGADSFEEPLVQFHQEKLNVFRYTQDQVDDVFLSMMVLLEPFDIQHVFVFFEPGPFHLSGDVWAAGLYTPGLEEIEIWASSACLAQTSLPHEIIHHWLSKTTGDSDNNHDDLIWSELETDFKPMLKEWLCSGVTE
jgi:hypothetical protein